LGDFRKTEKGEKMVRKVEVTTGGYKIHRATRAERKRAHEGFVKMQQALIQDEIEQRNRGSGLPTYWRNRIIRN
jgi:hypothetical protein